MSSAMQSAWITNLGDAVPSSTDDRCYGILSAAHDGAQRASAQCGILWVPAWKLFNEWGFGNGEEGKSVIALAKEYQSPASLPRDAPKLGENMVHEASHASAEGDYSTNYLGALRAQSEDLYNAAHDLVEQRAAACYERVTHPGLSMRIAGMSPPMARTGMFLLGPTLAMLALAGWWAAFRRKRSTSRP